MTWSPEDAAEIKHLAAEKLVARLIEEAGGIDSLIIIPMPAASLMTGLTRQTIPKRIAVTEMSPGKHGVTLKNLRSYIATKTTGPKTENAKSRG